MIKVKTITWGKVKSSDPVLDILDQKLGDFINQVGYENIKQILVYSAYTSPRYTVIYEE